AADRREPGSAHRQALGLAIVAGARQERRDRNRLAAGPGDGRTTDLMDASRAGSVHSVALQRPGLRRSLTRHLQATRLVTQALEPTDATEVGKAMPHDH